MERPDELVEVEVDDDLPPSSAVARKTQPRAGSRPRERWSSRRRLGIGTAAVVATVVGGVVATGAEDRANARDDAAVLAAAGVPGTVGSLRRPLTHAWPLAGRLVGSTAGLVLVEEGEPAELVARMPNGQPAWRVPLTGWGAGSLRCPADLGAGEFVVCEAPAREITAPNTSATLVQDAGALLLIGSQDGAGRQTWALPAGTFGWGVLEDSSVAVVSRSDGEVVVRRLTPGAQTPDWTVRVDLPDGTSARTVTATVRPGSVVVSGAVGLVVRADGTHLGPWLPEPGTAAVDVEPVPAGAVVWRSPRRGELQGADGPEGLEVAGQAARFAVDDGSAADVLLLLDGTPDVVRAVRLDTGEVLWERPARASDLLFRMEGLVVMVVGQEVVAVDARSGAERWRSGAGGPDTPLVPAVTDGVRLLLPGYAPATGRTVMGLALLDGRPVWEVALPAGAWRFAARGDVVVAGAGGRALVLSPSPPFPLPRD